MVGFDSAEFAVVKFDIVTIFPRMFEAPLAEGVVGRGIESGIVDVAVHDLRDFTTDRHRTVDDVPFGGGPGMVLKAEPLFRAVDRIRKTRGEPAAVLLTSPQGRPFTQAGAERLRAAGHVVILCGRYEGVDDRVREHLATEEISIGDYVLSGGEIAALVVVDAVSRLVPGVVGDAGSVDSRFVCARAAGLPAVYAAGRFSRLAGARCVAVRTPRARRTRGAGARRCAGPCARARTCWRVRRWTRTSGACYVS